MTTTITKKALLSRINRKLAPNHESVRKARKTEPSLGEFYLLDEYRNVVMAVDVDLEEAARVLEVLAAGEHLERATEG